MDRNSAPTNQRNGKKTPALKLGCWNVRTMTTGISSDLQTINDLRKTTAINNELLRLHIDIAALQETRLADYGSLTERDYTFFWQGKKEEETREYGVGFAVKNTLMESTEVDSSGTERFLSLRLNTSEGPVNLLSVYAPTLMAPSEIKDNFYNQLDDVIKKFPAQEALIILGDFNARVGSDHEAWPTCVGHFGIGNMNDNGQRLLETCSYHDLCITNTFFGTKPHHRVSWMHPRSKHWHQLDLIITRRSFLKNFLVTRSYHSADCNTDHSLVCSKVKILPKKIHRSRSEAKPRVDAKMTANADMVDSFNALLSTSLNKNMDNLDANGQWEHIKVTTHTAALSTFGKKKTVSNDWYPVYAEILDPLIKTKRTALHAYKSSPSASTQKDLANARRDVQKMVRKCTNEYWIDLCIKIQAASDNGNIKAMYDGIKKATGPTVRKTAPLKSSSGDPITDKTKQMERWVEHYSELYSRENIVQQSALDAIEQLPEMSHLDEVPTIEEVSQAIDKLPSGKAPGKDCIPAEAIKCGKASLLEPLHKLLCQCWKEGSVPQDMRDATIVTIYKNKGDRSDCNNYRGISLLSIVGKLFARIALHRLQKLADRIYPESQCGFRSKRSTIDMIFSLRQLQEKCREQHQPLYLAFIDLTKAFDLVSRDGLFKMLPLIGCPPKLLSIIHSFHEDMRSTVQFDGATSEEFEVKSGVKQGCVLAPTLFGIFFALLLKHAFQTSTEGVYLHTRSDGRLFNLARLKAKTKIREVLIRDMLFADDAAIAAHSESDLQKLMNRFAAACDLFGLTISQKKTQVMGQSTPAPPSIHINNQNLEAVHQFTYLGTTVTDTLSLDTEINIRIGKAATTLARLTKKVWENNQLTTKTKMAVYRACVLSTLLYGSEAWTTYTTQERKLNAFHLRCLRRILGISWKDKVTNNEVLSQASIPSMYTLLRERRLRWLGHVHRMEDGRIPKDLLYGELASGQRGIGRPHLRFKDVCKRDMKSISMDHDTWEDTASNRTAWKQQVATGLKFGEVSMEEAANTQRAKRKASQCDPTQATQQDDQVFTCQGCKRICKSRIGLFSHTRSCSSVPSDSAP